MPFPIFSLTLFVVLISAHQFMGKLKYVYRYDLVKNIIIDDIFIIASISCWWKIASFDHWRDETKHFRHSQTTFYTCNPHVSSCPIHPHLYYTITGYFDVNLVLNRQFISLLRNAPVIHRLKINLWMKSHGLWLCLTFMILKADFYI